MNRYYKLTRPDGFDFYTGKTINYAENIGKVVSPPNPNASRGLCSSGVIHASVKPNDCFIGARIPCRAFLVEGEPVATTTDKAGFTSLKVIEEIADLDALFGWKYSEAVNPINPLKVRKHQFTAKDKALLKEWASVGASVWASVGDSVWDSVGASVWDSVGDSVGASVWDSVGASVWDSVGASVWDSVWAYIGSLFPNMPEWKAGYPFQPCVDLWKRGFIVSFDGTRYRVHQGEKAEIIYQVTRKELDNVTGT